MSRYCSKKVWITGSLEVQSTLAIGGVGGHSFWDAPLACDGLGRYFLPGSSLAGALRAFATNELGADASVICRLFGTLESASRLTIADAPGEAGVEHVEVIDHVSIDRHRGAAADHHKFDQQRWQAGSRFAFNLSAELSRNMAEADAEASLLQQLVDALISGCVRFGGKTTRGQGEVKLKFAQRRELHLTRADLLDYLRNDSVQCCVAPISQVQSDTLSIAIKFKPMQPVMMKASRSGSHVDTLPRFQRIDNGKHALILTGHSIAGVLRTRAEKIVRSLMAVEEREDFLEQIDVLVVNSLFGAAKPKPTFARTADPKTKAQLRVSDCLSITHHVTDTELNQLGSSEQGHVFQNHRFKPLWNVALDRWTQAPKEGALFNVLAPIAGDWHPMTLTFHARKAKNSAPSHVQDAENLLLRQAQLALLCHVLADLKRGELAFGFATRRGMGTITVEKVVCTATGRLAAWNGLDPTALSAEQWLALLGCEDPISAYTQNPLSVEGTRSDVSPEKALQTEETV
jgi:CRISPR/Cas system CSM-associated protein Csm3 (group 7 of RAMP superfamily)